MSRPVPQDASQPAQPPISQAAPQDISQAVVIPQALSQAAPAIQPVVSQAVLPIASQAISQTISQAAPDLTSQVMGPIINQAASALTQVTQTLGSAASTIANAGATPSVASPLAQGQSASIAAAQTAQAQPPQGPLTADQDKALLAQAATLVKNAEDNAANQVIGFEINPVSTIGAFTGIKTLLDVPAIDTVALKAEFEKHKDLADTAFKLFAAIVNTVADTGLTNDEMVAIFKNVLDEFKFLGKSENAQVDLDDEDAITSFKTDSMLAAGEAFNAISMKLVGEGKTALATEIQSKVNTINAETVKKGAAISKANKKTADKDADEKEEKAADKTEWTEVFKQAARAAVILTLCAAVPPPFGPVLGGAFAYFTKKKEDQKDKADENNPTEEQLKSARYSELLKHTFNSNKFKETAAEKNETVEDEKDKKAAEEELAKMQKQAAQYASMAPTNVTGAVASAAVDINQTITGVNQTLTQNQQTLTAVNAAQASSPAIGVSVAAPAQSSQPAVAQSQAPVQSGPAPTIDPSAAPTVAQSSIAVVQSSAAAPAQAAAVQSGPAATIDPSAAAIAQPQVNAASSQAPAVAANAASIAPTAAIVLPALDLNSQPSAPAPAAVATTDTSSSKGPDVAVIGSQPKATPSDQETRDALGLDKDDLSSVVNSLKGSGVTGSKNGNINGPATTGNAIDPNKSGGQTV